MPVTESDSNDHLSTSKVEEALNSLRSKLADSPEYQDKLDEISDWVKEQKDKNKGKTDKIPFEDLSKVIITTLNSVEKLKSKDALKITTGVSDIVSSVANLVGKPYGPGIRALFGIISSLLTENKPQQPSVVDQLAKVAHEEMVHFNRRLHDQKYNGLKRRVTDQVLQLQSMKRGEKLDDPKLWIDYVQFMGELANRFDSPLPFKYERLMLTEDPDVADFVTAVVTYCEAYCCFMAVLVAARAKYGELGITHKEDEDAVERRLNSQMKDAKEKLSFLSEKRFLTFLGRLPHEGGKLTKIVALSRNVRGKSLVEAVRGSLDLSPMQDLTTVESAARKVAGQSVKLKLAIGCSGFLSFLYQLCAIRNWVQFINDVDFPMKIVSGTVGWSQGNQLNFVKDVGPRASYSQDIPQFSTAGYMVIYFNNILSSDVEPPPGNVRVIEFALSFVYFESKISIQDKTNDEFTHGLDTYNKRSVEVQTLYFFEGGKHYVVQAEVFVCYPDRVWRFVIQDFDPEAVQN